MMDMENKKIIHSSFWSNFYKDQPKISETETFICTLPPFSDLSKRDIYQVSNLLHKRDYLAGEYIFYQGDPGIGLYLIHDGDVEIQRIDDMGKSHILASFSRGDIFGELALIDGEKRSASAIARTDTKLSVLFKPDLDELVAKYPKKGLKILQGFTSILVSRLRKLNEDYFQIQRELNREKIHGTEY